MCFDQEDSRWPCLLMLFAEALSAKAYHLELYKFIVFWSSLKLFFFNFIKQLLSRSKKVRFFVDWLIRLASLHIGFTANVIFVPCTKALRDWHLLSDKLIYFCGGNCEYVFVCFSFWKWRFDWTRKRVDWYLRTNCLNLEHVVSDGKCW